MDALDDVLYGSSAHSTEIHERIRCLSENDLSRTMCRRRSCGAASVLLPRMVDELRYYIATRSHQVNRNFGENEFSKVKLNFRNVFVISDATTLYRNNLLGD